MDISVLLCTLQDAVADGKTRQVLFILKQTSLDVASLLLTSSLDDENTTLLHISASHPSADILAALLHHGAEVNWQNLDGLTALHVAANWGSEEAVRTLLEHGADPLIRDGEGLLPIDHARKEGHVECVHLLEGHSIDEDSDLSDDDVHDFSDDDHALSDSRLEMNDQREHEMSMAEAFVSMYSDSNSDTELEEDLTSVTQLSPSEDYSYTPSPRERLNRARTHPSPSHYSLMRQRLVYSPPRCASESAEFNDSLYQDCDDDDSVLYATAVEESYVKDRSTSIVGGVKGGAYTVESGDSKSAREAESPLKHTFTLKKDCSLGRHVDLLCGSFSSLTTSIIQPGQTSSGACSTPPASTRQSRQTGLSSCTKSTHQSGHTGSTPSPLDCSFVADIQVSIPEKLRSLTEMELREKLLALGERPGPITPTTKVAYLAYLAKLEAGIQPSGNKGYKGYKYELALVLNGTVPLPDLTQLEQQVFKTFRTPSHPIAFTPSPITTHRSQNSTSCSSSCSTTHKATPITRQATPQSPFKTPPMYGSPKAAKDRGTKDHFNYLLLDPRVLDRLAPKLDLSTSNGGSSKQRAVDELERFRIFVESVFYVGKGKNSRSMQHLKDAKESLILGKTKVSTKLCRILDIWSAGYGVVSLQIFHNTTASEAFTREACIIEAIGIDLLTNIQRGHVYGDVSGWSLPRRRQLGVHLLHKAYQSYRLHPPQQIYQTDL